MSARLDTSGGNGRDKESSLLLVIPGSGQSLTGAISEVMGAVRQRYGEGKEMPQLYPRKFLRSWTRVLFYCEPGLSKGLPELDCTTEDVSDSEEYGAYLSRV